MNNNPLSQYFRRPAVYLRLPSDGKGYSPDVIEFPENRELPVYPMSAIDEITVKTPDALYNGTAVVELVKSCIPAIKDPWKILSVDFDAILVAIKTASSGDSLEISSTCPKCKENATYGISLLNVLSSIKASNYDKVLDIGDLKFKFRPLIYTDINKSTLDQIELQKVFNEIENTSDIDKRNQMSKDVLVKITMLTIEIIAKTIEYIETPSTKVEEYDFIMDFLKKCDRNIFNSLKDYNAGLKKEAEIKPVHLKCGNCGNEYDQAFTLNPSDFFV